MGAVPYLIISVFRRALMGRAEDVAKNPGNGHSERSEESRWNYGDCSLRSE
jgi:hypothetical protein